MNIYDHETKNRVRLLRVAGLSLGQIYKETNIPKTTIRGWISDIALSPEQQKVLKDRVFKVLQEGRIKAEKLKREKRISLANKLFAEGKKDIGTLTPRELFVAGVALYWAEGFRNKHEKRLGFCNSDPAMIGFYLRWLQEVLRVSKKNITARLTLNKSYKEKELQIKEYWSKITGVPISQFTKTFYQNTLWKKQYNVDNYHGVLRIHVRESLTHLLKMKGWIEGFKSNLSL